MDRSHLESREDSKAGLMNIFIGFFLLPANLLSIFCKFIVSTKKNIQYMKINLNILLFFGKLSRKIHSSFIMNKKEIASELHS